jgi:hypothetical protein
LVVVVLGQQVLAVWRTVVILYLTLLRLLVVGTAQHEVDQAQAQIQVVLAVVGIML